MVILKPFSDGHGGDTFREMIDLWKENGLCEVKSANVSNVWIGAQNNILLYDRPTMKWYNSIRDHFKFALFGNPKSTLPNSSSWIFWGRRPRLMEKIRIEEGIKPLEERDIESIFLGKVENNIQQKKRTSHNWTKSVEKFEMPIKGQYKYSQYQYLQLLNRSRYGLCLPGYGDKCNREIELLSLGVVPIITPGVDLTYYNPLEEGVHYIKVNSPGEIKEKINSISDDEWEDMSEAGLEWFEKNASIKGSFNTTMEILKNNNLI